MTSYQFSVSVDVEADAAYVGMSDAEVARSVQASDEIVVDLDQFNMVAGIEFLRIDAEIPFQRLIDDYHVPLEQIEKLRALRPSIAARLQSGSDGSSSSVRSGVLSPA